MLSLESCTSSLLSHLKLYLPVSGQKRTVSMMDGARSASVDELAAPTSEMNRSRRGMAAARPTGWVAKSS